MRNGSGEGSASLPKSILHNIGVAIVGFGVAFIGTRIDSLVGIRGFASGFATAMGCLLFEPRIYPTGMGDVLLLRTPDEGDLPGTAEGADYLGSLWLLQKPALSRRKRLHLFWGGAVVGIAGRTRRHRHPYTAARSFHPARGTAIGGAAREAWVRDKHRVPDGSEMTSGNIARVRPGRRLPVMLR
jgi:hypothetical protein